MKNLQIQLVLIIFYLMFLSTNTLKAQTAQVTLDKAEIEKINAIFAHFNNNTPGAALAVVVNGEIIYKQGYGMSNLEYDIPITPSSIFQVGSIAKQFTAMCFILLAQQGKLSADDDIRKYLPEVPDFGETITIRHLLYHTSGLREERHLLAMAGWRDSDVRTRSDVINLISRQKELNFKPGEEFLYCNTGYTLLAEIIDRAAGISLREFADENIFKPLDMKNTHFSDNHLEIIKNRTHAYSPGSSEDYIINDPANDNYGATSLFTTVEDLALWIDNFSHKRVGTEEGINMLLTSGKLNNGEELNYALGVVHSTFKGLKIIASGGHDPGYRAEFIIVPEHETSIIVFSNADNANLSNGNPKDLLFQVSDIVLADYIVEQDQQTPQSQQERRQIPEPPVLNADQLKEYFGKFFSEELDAFQRIVMKDNALILQTRKRGEVELRVEKADIFSFGGSNIIKFIRNEQNNIIAYTITTPFVRNLKFVKKL